VLKHRSIIKKKHKALNLKSYLTIQKIKKSKYNIAVLNSVANVQKEMNFLKTHKEIYTYLDNDESGRKATELIKSSGISVNNRSTNNFLNPKTEGSV
jgi:hypothetical protein